MATRGDQRRGAPMPSAPTGTRPRYSRLAAAGGAFATTLVAVLGGVGVLPAGRGVARAASAPAAEHPPEGLIRLSGAAAKPGASTATTGATSPDDLALPADSGSGRRIVFDMTHQRVWLVATGADTGRDTVRRTYPVSGSLTDNLQPGTYSVYSRSLDAWGVDDSGSMKYMVR